MWLANDFCIIETHATLYHHCIIISGLHDSFMANILNYWEYTVIRPYLLVESTDLLLYNSTKPTDAIATELRYCIYIPQIHSP